MGAFRLSLLFTGLATVFCANFSRVSKSAVAVNLRAFRQYPACQLAGSVPGDCLGIAVGFRAFEQPFTAPNLSKQRDDRMRSRSTELLEPL